MIPYGNVIFEKGTKKIANTLTDWLFENGIISIGRFGKWKCLWSDQSFVSGYNATKKII